MPSSFKWNWLSEEPNGDASVYAVSLRDSEKVAFQLAFLGISGRQEKKQDRLRTPYKMEKPMILSVLTSKMFASMPPGHRTVPSEWFSDRKFHSDDSTHPPAHLHLLLIIRRFTMLGYFFLIVQKVDMQTLTFWGEAKLFETREIDGSRFKSVPVCMYCCLFQRLLQTFHSQQFSSLIFFFL